MRSYDVIDSDGKFTSGIVVFCCHSFADIYFDRDERR